MRSNEAQTYGAQANVSLLAEFDPALIFYYVAMYWIYVLKNKNSNELYYGYTNDLERRLKEHKVGTVWTFIGCEGYASELDARERERKLKQYGQARTHLKNRLRRSLSS